MSNAAVGVGIVTWKAAGGDTFPLSRKDIEGCVKGTYEEAGYGIKIGILGRLVRFQVVFERPSGECCLLGGGSKPAEPEEAAPTLVGELLRT
jgi:hypothetical protein